MKSLRLSILALGCILSSQVAVADLIVKGNVILLDFGVQAVGSQTLGRVDVTNDGSTGTIFMIETTVTGDGFALVTPPNPTLGSFISFGTDISFNPTTDGIFVGQLEATGESVFGGVETIQVELRGSTTALTCVGFAAPMDRGPVTVERNRVLPHKAQLLDEMGTPLNDFDITAAPVIQVMFAAGIAPAVDVTSDALSPSAGTDGNQFGLLGSHWQLNLKTRDYSAAGTYTTTMESGDPDAYVIDPTCTGRFVID